MKKTNQAPLTSISLVLVTAMVLAFAVSASAFADPDGTGAIEVLENVLPSEGPRADSTPGKTAVTVTTEGPLGSTVISDGAGSVRASKVPRPLNKTEVGYGMLGGQGSGVNGSFTVGPSIYKGRVTGAGDNTAVGIGFHAGLEAHGSIQTIQVNPQAGSVKVPKYEGRLRLGFGGDLGGSNRDGTKQGYVAREYFVGTSVSSDQTLNRRIVGNVHAGWSREQSINGGMFRVTSTGETNFAQVRSKDRSNQHEEMIAAAVIRQQVEAEKCLGVGKTGKDELCAAILAQLAVGFSGRDALIELGGKGALSYRRAIADGSKKFYIEGNGIGAVAADVMGGHNSYGTGAAIGIKY